MQLSKQLFLELQQQQAKVNVNYVSRLALFSESQKTVGLLVVVVVVSNRLAKSGISRLARYLFEATSLQSSSELDTCKPAVAKSITS